MDLLLLIIVIFVIGVAFSAVETAFTAFDRVLLEGWVRANRTGARVTRWLCSPPDRFLSTTLIGNNISNVAYASLITAYYNQLGLGEITIAVISFVAGVFALVFSEILPKTIAYGFANRMVRVCSWPLAICYVVVSPIRWLLYPLTRLVNRPKGQDKISADLAFHSEIEQVLAGAADAEIESKAESALLARYLDARELKVRDIMTPRTEMVAISVDSTVAEARQLFVRHRHNILPVYREDVDHVIGYVRARDLLDELGSLLEIVRPMHAVPESKLLIELLQEFRRGRRHVALVIDEYGGTDGLVTIKDIWEELVGPVSERWDPNEPIVKRTAPGKFLISGAAFLEDISEITGWIPPETEANTLAGLLAERLGRIPDAGEEPEISGAKFRVIRRTPRRVEGCLMKFSKAVASEPRGT